MSLSLSLPQELSSKSCHYGSILYYSHRMVKWCQFWKKDKPKSKVDSYRPISLTSCICKLAERMIYSRLCSWLKKQRKLHSNQAGFREAVKQSTSWSVSPKIQLMHSRRKIVWLHFLKTWNKPTTMYGELDCCIRWRRLGYREICTIG